MSIEVISRYDHVFLDYRNAKVALKPEDFPVISTATCDFLRINGGFLSPEPSFNLAEKARPLCSLARELANDEKKLQDKQKYLPLLIIALVVSCVALFVLNPFIFLAIFGANFALAPLVPFTLAITGIILFSPEITEIKNDFPSRIHAKRAQIEPMQRELQQLFTCATSVFNRELIKAIPDQIQANIKVLERHKEELQREHVSIEHIQAQIRENKQAEAEIRAWLDFTRKLNN